MNTAKQPDPLPFDLLAQAFNDEEKAREIIEASRWPDGPVCPHCDSKDVARLKARPTSVRPGRPGLLKCRSCRKQFTVKVGTVMEGSHIRLNQWLYAIHAMNASKKGVSAHQLHRTLGLDYKSAWFLCHRVRFAMENGPLKGKVEGAKMPGPVEADETYVGGKRKGKRGRGAEGKSIVLTLISREGEARSFHVPNVKGKTLKSVIRQHVEGEATIYTDSLASYNGLRNEFAGHETVDHSMGKRRGEPMVRTKGPRGGKTTVYKSGLQRKTCYFYEEEWDALRRAAFERDTGVAEIIREAVRQFLKLEDQDLGLRSP